MINEVKNVFIVGIKGTAMVNLALILKKMGKNVTGSDSSEEFITDDLLNANNISCSVGFETSSLPSQTDLVVYSAANGGENNPQVVGAKDRGIRVLHQAELIEEIMKQFQKKIAVCGSHGKTTTAALLAYTLSKLGANPSYLVGAQFSNMWGGDYQKGDYFVLEADEYAVNPPADKTPKLTFYHPDYILALNIDFDHPDVYRNLKEVQDTFADFFKGKAMYVCIDDTNLMNTIGRLSIKNYRTFGFTKGADLRVLAVTSHEAYTSFQVEQKNGTRTIIQTSLFGEKNVSNVAGVILLLIDLGFSMEKIKYAIKNFTGVKRRFEKKTYINDIYLFDDYAHHPSEIEATIEAARARFPNRRLIIVFQPHTFSRTEALKSEFQKALSKTNISLVAPIFASAREDKKKFAVTSFDLARGSDNVLAFSSKIALMHELEKKLQNGDVVFTMGAGDIYKLESDIIKTIKSI